ncbi:MAG: hypothetical protein ACQGVK_19740 [Myxococcota bacterium]
MTKQRQAISRRTLPARGERRASVRAAVPWVALVACLAAPASAQPESELPADGAIPVAALTTPGPADAAPFEEAPDPCRAWPDEPSPLPVVWDGDPITARWARARANELADQAASAEGRSLEIAIGLWERVLCLDPESVAAVDAVERAANLPGPATLGGGGPDERPPLPAVSAAPPVAGGTTVAGGATVATVEPVSGGLTSGWPFMLEVLPPYVAPPAAAEVAVGIDLSDVDQELSEIRLLTEEAHFRTALAVAGATRDLLDRAGDAPAVEIRRARLEVLSATAAVALGRDTEARAHMAAALGHDPELRLDARSTSPKVLALLREARGEGVRRISETMP